MTPTVDAHEAVAWIEAQLASGATVTVQQSGVRPPVEWTPERWARMTDDLHIPVFKTRGGQVLMCVTTAGWDGSPEYMAIDHSEVAIFAR